MVIGPQPKAKRPGFPWLLDFIKGEGGWALLLRMSAVCGTFWGITQFNDRFLLVKLPTGFIGVWLFILNFLSAWLLIEIAILLHSRPLPNVVSEHRTPEQVFADSVLQYARALAESTPPRDHSLLELRSWTSRLLHLTGNHDRRQELGQLALTAAFALQDHRSQAAILIDDLGWSVLESGDADTALENIREGIQIIDDQLRIQKMPDPFLIDMKCKGQRHLANIQAKSLPLNESRLLLAPPRAMAEQLSGPQRELNLAQLDHSEAQLILNALVGEIGRTGQVDRTGQTSQLLDEAVHLVESAEKRFEATGDMERQAKALGLKVQLLSHDTRKQRYRAAEAQLERLRNQVARKS